MALTLLGDPPQRIELENDRAVLVYHYEADSDIPNVADTIAEVDADGTWYCEDVTKVKDRIQTVRVTARLPGMLWTQYGLAPITSRGTYVPQPSVKIDPSAGGTTYNYDGLWSNWDDTFDWDLTEVSALIDGLATWEVEWIDATRRTDMLGKKNGTWPTGFTAPVATAGAFLCKTLEAVYEPGRNHDTGAITTRYRNFATFWQAPIVNSVQMLWRNSTW